MFDKLKKFLVAQASTKDEALNEIDAVLKEKEDFVTGIFSIYTHYLDGYVESADKSASFSDHLEKLELSSSLTLNADPRFFNDDAQIAIFKDLLLKNYTPPKDLFSLHLHLKCLMFWYTNLSKNMREVSLPLQMRLDLALAKIAEQATIAIMTINTKGKRELDRTFKTKQSRKEKAGRWKKKVVTCIEQMTPDEKKVFKRLSQRKQAIIIQEKLNKTDTGIPGAEAIRKYLKELDKM